MSGIMKIDFSDIGGMIRLIHQADQANTSYTKLWSHRVFHNFDDSKTLNITLTRPDGHNRTWIIGEDGKIESI